MAAPYRVRRSRIDDYFDRDSPLPYVRVGAGEVVDVTTDAETCTVDFDGELVAGVVVLGDPPLLHDWVEIHQRGDLLVTPETPPEVTETFSQLVYVQPDEPLGVPVGTLWFDTDEVRP
jgi:hypothetical protein